MGDENAASTKVFEVRAQQPREHGERVAARYQVTCAAAALAAFAAERPDICGYHVGRQGWQLKVVIPGVGEPPERRLLNWERDPNAEVSDGWLSNIAAMANTLQDRLEWEPQFCPRPHWFTPCPGCGSALAERYGKWGAFYSCSACGQTMGVDTKKGKAAESAARIIGWCGTLLEVRYGHFGNPYAGCPACAPTYRHPTVDDLHYGRSRR